MTRTAKKLAQTALASTPVTVYTAPALTTTQVVEIWIANTNASTARIVTLYAHGTGTTNVLIPGISVPASDFKVIDSAKIVLSAGDIIYCKQDTNTDVTVTVYGVEETA